MKHVSPTSNYHYWKATQPKTKKDYSMITVEEALLFAEWLNERYIRSINEATKGKWYEKYYGVPKYYTTRELWEQYQKFLGNKRPVSDPKR